MPVNCRYGLHDVAYALSNNSRFMSDFIMWERTDVTDAQMHEVDLLFECVRIRDDLASLPCWFSNFKV